MLAEYDRLMKDEKTGERVNFIGPTVDLYTRALLGTRFESLKNGMVFMKHLLDGPSNAADDDNRRAKADQTFWSEWAANKSTSSAFGDPLRVYKHYKSTLATGEKKKNPVTFYKSLTFAMLVFVAENLSRVANVYDTNWDLFELGSLPNLITCLQGCTILNRSLINKILYNLLRASSWVINGNDVLGPHPSVDVISDSELISQFVAAVSTTESATNKDLEKRSFQHYVVCNLKQFDAFVTSCGGDDQIGPWLLMSKLVDDKCSSTPTTTTSTTACALESRRINNSVRDATMKTANKDDVNFLTDEKAANTVAIREFWWRRNILAPYVFNQTLAVDKRLWPPSPIEHLANDLTFWRSNSAYVWLWYHCTAAAIYNLEQQTSSPSSSLSELIALVFDLFCSSDSILNCSMCKHHFQSDIKQPCLNEATRRRQGATASVLENFIVNAHTTVTSSIVNESLINNRHHSSNTVEKIINEYRQFWKK